MAMKIVTFGAGGVWQSKGLFIAWRDYRPGQIHRYKEQLTSLGYAVWL